MIVILSWTVTLIVDHSYFALTQHIILRTKGLSVERISHNQSSPSKRGLNNATILKILITYGRCSYYLNYSHDYVSANSNDISLFLIFLFLEDFPLHQPFLNKLNDQLKNVWFHIGIAPFMILTL
jgi:hypothetical protein